MPSDEATRQAGSAGDDARAVRAGALGLTVAIVVFWWRKVLGGEGPKALDAFEYFYPSYLWLSNELAAGHFPLWNPYQLCGVPTLDPLQSGLLYPFHLLYVVLPTDLGMATSGLLHLLIAGAATWAFALRAGLGVLPACAAALLVATRGAQPGHVINPSMQEAGAWLAVGMIGVLAASRGRPLAGALWMAGATAMTLLAGFPQYGVYAAYAWGVVAIALTLGPGPGLRRAAVSVAAVVGGVGLGAMLAAVVLLPALELVEIGGRGRGTMPLPLMLPFGRAGFETVGRAIGTVVQSRPAVPGLLFSFGLAGLGLAAGLVFRHPARRLGATMVGLALLAGLFALGPATPAFEWLLRLPEVGTFRNPWRVLYVADFAIAIAAAVGLAAVLRRVVGDAAAITHAATPTDAAVPTDAARRRLAVGGAALALIVLETAIAPGNPRRLPYDARDPLLAPFHEARPVVEALAREPDRVLTIFAGAMDDVSEKWAGLFGLRSISDVEILTLARQREYFTWLYWGALEPTATNARGTSQRIFYGHYSLLAPGIAPREVAARARLLDLAAARHVLVPRSAVAEAPVATFLRASGARPVDVSDRQLVVLERPRALPRAYVARAVAPAPDPATLLAALARDDFDPRRLSYVEAEAEEPIPRLAPGAGDARVELVEDGPERVVLRARLDAPGLVVLADTWHPGWRATVDGESARIWPTNHLFRGVAVPEGEHEIVFRYRPTPVYVGAAISAAGVAIFVAGVLAQRRRD